MILISALIELIIAYGLNYFKYMNLKEYDVSSCFLTSVSFINKFISLSEKVSANSYKVRLQSRLSRVFGVDSVPDLHLAIQANNLSEGLEEQLETFVKEHKDVKVIIIDTLQKVREVYGDKCSYGSDYEVVTKLKKFSDKHNVCLLVVHHTRKMEANDCFDMISGTNGLLGAADGAFVMQKDKRTGNSANLEMAGRD